MQPSAYYNRVVDVIEELRRLSQLKIPLAMGVPAKADVPDRPASGTPLSRCYPPPSILGEVLRLPAVRGIVTSLVGDDPLYDHDFVHVLPAQGGFVQHLLIPLVSNTLLRSSLLICAACSSSAYCCFFRSNSASPHVHFSVADTPSVPPGAACAVPCCRPPSQRPLKKGTRAPRVMDREFLSYCLPSWLGLLEGTPEFP